MKLTCSVGWLKTFGPFTYEQRVNHVCPEYCHAIVSLNERNYGITIDWSSSKASAEKILEHWNEQFALLSMVDGTAALEKVNWRK